MMTQYSLPALALIRLKSVASEPTLFSKAHVLGATTVMEENATHCLLQQRQLQFRRLCRLQCQLQYQQPLQLHHQLQRRPLSQHDHQLNRPLIIQLPAQLFIPRFHRHSTRRFRPRYTQQLVLLSLLRPLHPYPQDHPYSSSFRPLASPHILPQKSQYGYPSLPSHPSPNLPSPNLPRYSSLPSRVSPSRVRMARVAVAVVGAGALGMILRTFKHSRISLRLEYHLDQVAEVVCT
mmetsp:Transcript_13558/g.17213  ORF Transcript_13558/g.17213 Transcript_13558/m.17213 type:complete len:235 (-) Transcript_13558:221-925(-)